MNKVKNFNPPNAISYLKENFNITFTTGTLAAWRCQGKGPRYTKLAGKIYYRQEDLDSYVDTAQLIETTDSHTVV